MKLGIIIGKFFPLHIGHVNLIQQASGVVDKMYVIITHSDQDDEERELKSRFVKKITPKDRLRYVKQTFKNHPYISTFLFKEEDGQVLSNEWSSWANKIKDEINKREPNLNWEDDVVFISNMNGDYERNKRLFGSKTLSFDGEFNHVNSEDIRKNPSKNWDFLPREVREHLIPIITICGGESSGKSVMVDKLANVFNTTSAWEYGREYIFEKLGGDEDALQYSDYEKIVFGHLTNVLYAARNANKFALVDTDYITTLAFCLEYEKRDNPIIREFIENYKFDLTILMENNVKWVNDGLRSLGESKKRKQFQDLLKHLYKEYKVPYVLIKSDNYEKRYLACKAVIMAFLDGEEDLQSVADRF